jgi:hypothetical protein
MRALIRATQSLRRFEPSGDTARWAAGPTLGPRGW